LASLLSIAGQHRGAQEIVVRSLSGGRGADSHQTKGIWRFTNQNTIHMSWNGIQATLHRGSTDDLWTGTMESSSDDGRVIVGPDISVRPVSEAVCDQKP
jgi:uncharacterized membrane protein